MGTKYCGFVRLIFLLLTEIAKGVDTQNKGVQTAVVSSGCRR